MSWWYIISVDADLSQLVEQVIRNDQVVGSNPIVGSIENNASKMFSGLL